MVSFHIFYMASNRALRGFMEKIEPFLIEAIRPNMVLSSLVLW